MQGASNEKAAVGRDRVLPLRDALGGDACLKKDARRACRPCIGIKTDRNQLSVGLNEEDLLAVMAPAGLRGRPGRNLDAPAMSRKAFYENPTSWSIVRDPISIWRELGLGAINDEWLNLLITWGINLERRKSVLPGDGHEEQAAVWRPILGAGAEIRFQQDSWRRGAVCGNLISFIAHPATAVSNPMRDLADDTPEAIAAERYRVAT